MNQVTRPPFFADVFQRVFLAPPKSKNPLSLILCSQIPTDFNKRQINKSILARCFAATKNTPWKWNTFPMRWGENARKLWLEFFCGVTNEYQMSLMVLQCCRVVINNLHTTPHPSQIIKDCHWFFFYCDIIDIMFSFLRCCLLWQLIMSTIYFTVFLRHFPSFPSLTSVLLMDKA